MKKILIAVILLTSACNSFAITSKIVKHTTAEDFLTGKTDKTIINSRGNISLAAATELLSEDFADEWTINSIVKSADGTVYIGTSPNGHVYKYKSGKATLIYPAKENESEQIEDPNTQQQTDSAKHLQNLHIFKLALDAKGKLLVAVSGENCSLIKIDGKKTKTVFEPNDTGYIFDIELDKKGNIFLATGPEGKIFKLDKNCRNAELIYTCTDKNVMCLALDKDDCLYAGTDTRGLVYKINIKDKTASILYDSSEDEITDLLFDSEDNLYAAATSYKSIRAQSANTAKIRPLMSGKPENDGPPEGSASIFASLEIANTGPQNQKEDSPSAPPANLKRGKKISASHIYKIDPQGFVKEIFSETAVFFSLYAQDDNVLVGTGNKAQLYSINPASEIETLIYEDETASQITNIIAGGDYIYFGTANPAKLIALKSGFARQGSFESALIDAAQPARWGKLQLDAEIPDNTKILLSARSGNVDDINDKTYSDWSKPVEIDSPTKLDVPLGRFCQYKLILSTTKNDSPTVRQVAAAFVIPNLAPIVSEVTIAKAEEKSDAGIFKIDFKAKDDNSDTLIYKVDFRKVGRDNWIEIEDELKEPTINFDSKTVEDGKYEFRITASDKLSNDTTSQLSGSRVSEPVVVDNSTPIIKKETLRTEKDTAVLKLNIEDAYSVIKMVSYTTDSSKNWNNSLPVDGIFDTTAEEVTIMTEPLKAGSHVLSVKISDAENNTMYKSFDIEIKQ